MTNWKTGNDKFTFIHEHSSKDTSGTSNSGFLTFPRLGYMGNFQMICVSSFSNVYKSEQVSVCYSWITIHQNPLIEVR